MRHAMARGWYLSIPKMIPAICEYVTESSRVLLHCVCLVQQAGYACLKIAAQKIQVKTCSILLRTMTYIGSVGFMVNSSGGT